MLDDLPEDPVVLNVNVPEPPARRAGGLAPHRGGARCRRARSRRRELTPKVGHDDAFDVQMEWGDPIELPGDTDSGAVEAGLRRRHRAEPDPRRPGASTWPSSAAALDGAGA